MESGYFVETDGILTNKLGITDAEELVSTEYRITDEKIGQVLANYHPLEFNIACLLDIHRQLFDTIYPFAGKIRTVNISKPDSPVPFCYADFILPEANRIFSELAKDQYLRKLPIEDFSAKLAYYAAELNALHPFREGNGRTTRLFLVLLARNAGYLLDYAQASRNEILHADREAFAGNMTPIQNLYHKIVFKID